jgi:hypothetical protein
MTKHHHRILIVGGGAAGISVAATMRRLTPDYLLANRDAGRVLLRWPGDAFLLLARSLLPLLYWNYMLKGVSFDLPHKESYLLAVA